MWSLLRAVRRRPRRTGGGAGRGTDRGAERRVRLRAALPVAVALAATLLVTGCDEDAVPTQSAADVEFAQAMIPHHEQALRMVEMTEGRRLSPEFAHLTEHIHDAQQPEIETMTGWLRDWGEEVPGGHRHHEGMEMPGSGMAGMMSERDFDDLEGAGRSAFERMWLRMMIEHHEGAIEMARAEIAKGSFRPALDLAASIVETQTHEIDEMRAMLRR